MIFFSLLSFFLLLGQFSVLTCPSSFLRKIVFGALDIFCGPSPHYQKYNANFKKGDFLILLCLWGVTGSLTLLVSGTGVLKHPAPAAGGLEVSGR